MVEIKVDMVISLRVCITLMISKVIYNMRYAKIRKMDITNGENLGVSLFVQGCDLHCYNCFNPETWDFNGGKEWTEEVKKKFIELANKPYIHRVSILGGEPLAKEHQEEIRKLVIDLYVQSPQRKIWLYTGYSWEDIMQDPMKSAIVRYCDVVVDGEYIDSLKDLNLRWCGSTNQRVIDVQKTMEKDNIICIYDTK